MPSTRVIALVIFALCAPAAVARAQDESQVLATPEAEPTLVASPASPVEPAATVQTRSEDTTAQAALTEAALTEELPEAALPEPALTEDTATPQSEPSLVPAIADGRLAEVDDGIDDLFAAWASERIFSGSTPRSTSTFMLQTQLGLRFGITRDARARADWGFAYSTSHVGNTFTDATGMMSSYEGQVERVEAQNPTLQFEWAPVIGTTRFSFGLGVSAPTAAGENVPTNATQAMYYDATVVTHDLMLATGGGLTPWRYRRERMGLFLPLAFLFPLDRMTIAIEGAAAISAPVTGAGRVPVTGDLMADIQLSGDVIPEIRLGARFGIAVLDIGATTGAGTIVQPSATGTIRVRIDPGFLIASILADVGGYYGLGSGGGVWSATLGGGAAIP